MAGLLTRTALDEIIDAAIEAGLADPKLRSVLLGDLPPTLVAQLTAYGKPRAQIESDLGVLNRTPAIDGRLPLHTWLDAVMAKSWRGGPTPSEGEGAAELSDGSRGRPTSWARCHPRLRAAAPR